MYRFPLMPYDSILTWTEVYGFVAVMNSDTFRQSSVPDERPIAFRVGLEGRVHHQIRAARACTVRELRSAARRIGSSGGDLLSRCNSRQRCGEAGVAVGISRDRHRAEVALAFPITRVIT